MGILPMMALPPAGSRAGLPASALRGRETDGGGLAHRPPANLHGQGRPCHLGRNLRVHAMPAFARKCRTCLTNPLRAMALCPPQRPGRTQRENFRFAILDL